jgi:hypothetical protein
MGLFQHGTLHRVSHLTPIQITVRRGCRITPFSPIRHNVHSADQQVAPSGDVQYCPALRTADADGCDHIRPGKSETTRTGQRRAKSVDSCVAVAVECSADYARRALKAHAWTQRLIGAQRGSCGMEAERTRCATAAAVSCQVMELPL